MNIINNITGECDLIDLFEKWWHFPLFCSVDIKKKSRFNS